MAPGGTSPGVGPVRCLAPRRMRAVLSVRRRCIRALDFANEAYSTTSRPEPPRNSCNAKRFSSTRSQGRRVPSRSACPSPCPCPGVFALVCDAPTAEGWAGPRDGRCDVGPSVGIPCCGDECSRVWHPNPRGGCLLGPGRGRAPPRVVGCLSVSSRAHRARRSSASDRRRVVRPPRALFAVLGGTSGDSALTGRRVILGTLTSTTVVTV
jgi:hypothetical protein